MWKKQLVARKNRYIGYASQHCFWQKLDKFMILENCGYLEYEIDMKTFSALLEIKKYISCLWTCYWYTFQCIVSECIYEGLMYVHDMSDCLSVCFFVCLSCFRESSILLNLTTGLQDTHFLNGVRYWCSCKKSISLPFYAYMWKSFI